MVDFVTDQRSAAQRDSAQRDSVQRDFAQRDSKEEVGGRAFVGNTTSAIGSARQEFLAAFAKLDEQARAANPAKNDPLEVKANVLRGLAERVAAATASTHEVAQFTQGTKELAAATNAELALRKNPWSLAVNAPLHEQDKKNYNQVITLSVPTGQIVDLRQDGADRCGVKSSCVRLCPGSIAAREVNGSKVWRQSDPNKPGFDLITVATSPDKTVQTRCGLQEVKAFSGVMKFTNPCTCESYSVNVNNGAGNDHLKSATVAEGIAAPEIKTPLAATPIRPNKEELQYPSPSDNYLAQNFTTFDAYSEHMSRYNQLPGKYSVARAGEGLSVILKEGESLTLFNGGSEVGTFNPNLPETKRLLDTEPGVVAVGSYATIRRDAYGGYVLEPGHSHMDTEFLAKITKMERRAGEGPETVAERIFYIGDPTNGVGSERPKEQGFNAEDAKKIEIKPPTTELALPVSGTRITSQQAVSFTLGDDVAQDLYISKGEESPLGVLRPTDRKEVFEFSGAPELKFIREGKGNTFRIEVAEGASETNYKFTVRPRHDAGDILQQTRIIVGGEHQVKEKDTSPNTEVNPSPLKRNGPSVQPPAQPSIPKSSEPAQYVSKPSPVKEEVRQGVVRKADVAPSEESYKIAVKPGEAVSVDLYYVDPSGKRTVNALTALNIGSNALKTTVPGVGSVKRVTEADGTMYLVFTPDKGSRTGLSLAASR